MSFDSVVAVAWDVLKPLGVPIKLQFEYVMRSKRYADNLRKEVEKLKYEADRVRDAKEVAENNLLSIHVWVPEFLASAEKALTEAGDLLSYFETASKTCCYGTFPDPICRHTFSRTAKLQTDYIKNLVRDYSDREVSLRGSAPGNDRAPTPDSSALMSMELQGGGIGKSREPIIREIMAALADNSNSVVGVHGMGGVGKSTLVEEAKRKLSEENLFDWVTMANVSENPDIIRIQGEIAHALNLDIKNEANVNVRAELLRTRLEKEGKAKKRVLIILDNLWERLDLKSVGIPCGLDNKVRGCKLLLTSRRQDVLRREMGCDRDFHLDGLQEVEAKELFQRMVGDKVHDSEFKPFVDEALHKCAVVRGLPKLEEIKVVSCKLMHGILEADDCGKVELHNLRVLILCDLPDIKNFLNAGSAHSSSTLDDKASTQIAFFNGQQISIPSLESLTMQGLPNMKEIWSDESPLELSNLRSLNLVRCESLLKVISSQLLVKLRKLHNLCIRDCNSVQEIFDLDEPSTSEDLRALSS
ncbi:putative disease resistance protein At5g05400 [Eucalyptus grandis]|uniref:putative disease resistance protein At5g05400 n=1 Tax=Eucalyptus grandis TaxID=71139 RepID=UPI00192E95BD|nr:putative disease resistance protein At5g05400 [Eucalyptus grandis]